MADEGQQTPPTQNPEETGGEEPAATQPQGQQGAATDDDEMTTISTKDLRALQSQRDRNHETARATEQVVMEMAQKQDINEFLSDAENKKKFPDVETSDLMAAESPEEFEALAGQTQARIDKAAQRRLADIEKATDPEISPEEKAAQLKKLRANPSTGSLEQAIELKMK